MERAELSAILHLERLEPLATAFGPAREQTSREDERNKSRQRPLPPAEEAPAQPAEEDGDRIEHRIDSLA